MELSSIVIKTLCEFGVGKRLPQDNFFKTNETLSEMTKRISVFEIDIGKLGDNYEPFKCHVPGCLIEFESLVEYESHYNAAHKFSCCECRKNLPSAHLLDLHVAESHDSFFAALAERKPAYLCYLETCGVKFSNPEERMQHCIEEHRFPSNFRFDHKIQKGKNKSSNTKCGNNTDETISAKFDNSISNVSNNSKRNYIKPKQFTFHPSRPKSFQNNKSSGKKFTDDKIMKESTSVLENDEMLQELKESLSEF